MRTLSICFLVLFVTVVNAQNVIPVGHSHNDYKQRLPLETALSFGYTSLEIDLFLVNNKVKVAHTFLGLPFAKDLEDLYLNPLKSRLISNPKGIYGDSTTLVLMIDLKNKERALLDALNILLEDYKDLFLHNEGAEGNWAPLQLVVSGGPPMDWINGQKGGFFFADCPLKLSYEKVDDSAYCVRRSARWSDYFSWNGEGVIPAAERRVLELLVENTHAIGQKVRFWGIPPTVNCWSVLLEYNVDWINVDDLGDFALYYDQNH